MGKRLAKQLLYGFFYLIILAGLSWGIYIIALKPAPSCFDNQQNGNETGVDCGGNCIACEVKSLRPLRLSSAILFSSDRIFSAAAELQNPNAIYGAKSFDYKTNFYDAAGKILATVKNKGFIYASRTKNLIEAGVRITTGVPSRAEIQLVEKSIVWENNQDFFEPPYKLNIISLSPEDGQTAINGQITNPNNYNISKVIASAFLIDKQSAQVGASKTELQDIGAFQTKDFQISIPTSKELAPSVDLEATSKTVLVEALK